MDDQTLYAKTSSGLPAVGGRFLVFRDLPEIITKYAKGTKTLDYSCGSEYSTVYLKSLGLDVRRVEITKCKIKLDKAIDSQKTYSIITSRKIPDEDKTFDFVFAGLVLHYCSTKSEIVKIMKEIARVIKPNGIFAFSVDNEETYRNHWLTLDTNFEENNCVRSGSLVKTICKKHNLTIRHHYWTDKDYTDAMSDAGFELICKHKPLGKDSDGFKWICEKCVSQVTLYVVKLKSEN